MATTDTTEALAEPGKKISMVQFLETIPPDSQTLVADLAKPGRNGGLVINTPDISLHCSSDHCEGEQRFRCTTSETYFSDKRWDFEFITYVCRNCGGTTKVYSVALLRKAERSGLAQKFGEIPPFGPEVPAKVISLIGPDRDLFLRGRRSENHGLGIGAFSYYRRVVENQKNRIIGEMKKVAARLGAIEQDLDLFDEAMREIQFTTAVDKVKAAIPAALLIDGHHNPLTLLHDALSDGLHQMRDEECLEYAKEIRLLLTHLAERIAEVLRSDAELKGAVSKLLERVAKKKGAASES